MKGQGGGIEGEILWVTMGLKGKFYLGSGDGEARRMKGVVGWGT